MDYINHSVKSQLRSQKSFTLKPEEASFLDLFRIIFSGELQSKGFIECIQVIKEEILERRGAIFLTVLVHKALQFIANPLSRFGLCFEQCLNLLFSNTNVCLLLVNLLQKKVALPDKESANFLSIVGTLDKSVDLDKNIKPGDNSYFVALSAMASKIAYENKAFIKATVEERWKMELLGAYDFWNEYQQKKTTQAFILRDKTSESDTIIVAFRGTEPFDADAWCTDFDISWYNFQGVGRVHSGFMKALGLQKDESWPQQIQHNYINDIQLAYYAIREKLKGLFEKNSQAKFILTGHSLGGALAVLYPAILVMHNEKSILERLKAVYTFGQPKVGDDKFGQFMQRKFEECEVKYYRFVYSHDIVARMPYDNSAAAFEHFGTCIYLDNLYQAKIIISGDIEEKYLSVVSFFTKRVDAIWELIRSFIMPYIFGCNYRESLQLRLVRVLGILFPGLCDHGPQDYVYATRLGKLSYDSYI